MKIKNLLKKLIVFVLIIPVAFVFTACGTKGKSAYELAVENGYEGTLSEWLDSLKGSSGANGKDAPVETTYDMYLKAKELDEFNGSYIDFLKEVANFSYDDVAIVAENCFNSVLTIHSQNSKSITYSSGSGVVYSILSNHSAFVITNHHVTSGYDTFKLNIYNGTNSTAIFGTCIGGSATYDLSIIYIENFEAYESLGIKAATFNTALVRQGSTCFAIGNPNSDGLSITKGCVSVPQEEREISVAGYSTSHRIIRHDAYITHGNSGGGLFNAQGECIGITNGGLSATQSSDNSSIKFAIPASIVCGVAENLIHNCFDSENTKLRVCKLGIDISATENDVVVAGVLFGSIANRLGIHAGDTVIAITITNGPNVVSSKINNRFNIEDILLHANESSEIEVTVSRPGTAQNLKLSTTLTSDDFNDLV